MDVLFLSPQYPPEMQQFSRGLAQVGARVWGVGDAPVESLPDSLKRSLAGYLQVPAILDEDDVMRRVHHWLGDRRPDRVEGLWEVVTMLAARLRQSLGVPGMSIDAVRGFRDKPLMKQRVAAAGLPGPASARVHTVAEAYAAAERIRFPLVVKPVAGAGSADTYTVRNKAELDQALQATRAAPQLALEAFVTGSEFTYETLCVDGKPMLEMVSRYFPNCLEARQNQWISPIIFCHKNPYDPTLMPGVDLGRKVLKTLGMGTGFTHMEWFASDEQPAQFGEVACRPPGANMVDLMNYALDADLYTAWAGCVVRRHPGVQRWRRSWNAAIVFKRAEGSGRIHHIEGVEDFVRKYRPYVARVDFLPKGAPRRDWRQTFLSDGNIVVRHPDANTTLELAQEAAATIRLYAR